MGACFGPNYGMQLGADVFTPDMIMRGIERLPENTCHDCYMEGAANLVIEIVLPEHADIHEQVRRRYYEQSGVQHYWIFDPVAQQVQFWQWFPEGYRLQSLDADGCYRGVPGLTFSPEIFWLSQQQQRLPAFTSEIQPQRWVFRLGVRGRTQLG